MARSPHLRKVALTAHISSAVGWLGAVAGFLALATTRTSSSEVRVVEIVGLDLQADGGTHVARTGEVGRICVTGHESKGRINKRLRLASLDPV